MPELAIVALPDLAPRLPPRGALLGLDLGTKTIGVATSDPDRRLATGVETIARANFTTDARRLTAIAAERRAVAFVLGLPINMDGSEGPRAQSTRAFARNLAKATSLPVALWDERLSTAAVERELIAADVKSGKTQGCHRRACGDLHPAGRARPARKSAPSRGTAGREGPGSAYVAHAGVPPCSLHAAMARPRSKAISDTPKVREP